MRLLLAVIGRVCEIVWPQKMQPYRIDDEADALADIEAETEVFEPIRFGPAFEGEAGSSPVAASIDQPATGQPDYDLYMQAVHIAGLLRYHQLIDPSGHRCRCLHTAHSVKGHRRHQADLIVNMYDADHRVTQTFQS